MFGISFWLFLEQLIPHLSHQNSQALSNDCAITKQNNPHSQNLCHFKAVFFHWAVKRTLAFLERSGACHWAWLGNVGQAGWLIVSCLSPDWIVRPVMRKGAAAWAHFECSRRGSKTCTIFGLRQTPNDHADIPFYLKTKRKTKIRDTGREAPVIDTGCWLQRSAEPLCGTEICLLYTSPSPRDA